MKKRWKSEKVYGPTTKGIKGRRKGTGKKWMKSDM